MKRLGSILVVAGGCSLAAVRFMLDLIGWSTAPDDVPVFGKRLDQLLDLIFLTPWWLIWPFVFFATGFLMWVSWPRHAHAEAPLATSANSEDALLANETRDSDSVKLSSNEYENLIESVREADQSRRSMARKEQLLRDLDAAEILAISHRQLAEKMIDTAISGSFEEKNIMPYNNWYEGIKDYNDRLMAIRMEVGEILERNFREMVDFMATPNFDDNPHRVDAPGVSRLPREEFKHDYRKYYERLKRAAPIVDGLPNRLRAEIEKERQQIIFAGRP